MTTLLLGAADSLVGGVAGVATTLAGRAVTGLITGSSAAHDTVRATEGPRVTEMAGLTSTEGAPIPRLYGRARLGGQLIWATRFEEVATTTTSVDRQSQKSGGKSLGGARAATTTTVSTTYSYDANLAIGLCEGPIAFVRRVWADGREVDLTTLTMRVYPGTATQDADPLIVAKEGGENVPAYRGLAYVVFERMPLAPYGNRVPQFSFETIRPVGSLAPSLRSLCLIPGATEFGYDDRPVSRVLGLGASVPENVHQFREVTDLAASLDVLTAICPNVRSVSLVVAWFGDDLRAGACTITPRVDFAGKTTAEPQWGVSGLTRAEARETSRVNGVAAYGGTPSDESVVRAILDLKARGLAVTLYPFVMMDVPADNALPDPRSGAPCQPPYPWRGRITCDPAPGLAGSPDGTEEAAAQVAGFFGSAAPGDFSRTGGQVGYSGPPEWSYRRLALHCANLAVLAGGVDAMVIASELVGLTRIRSASGVYPAVGQLRGLAADIRATLGAGTRLTYGADWTEYGAHVLNNGTEIRFPLDPLWADPAIDAIGIDYYPPIADWRDEPGHLDEDTARSVYDADALRAGLAAGEAFDWYYASDADRAAQRRSPITDGAYGKPWIYRAKDLASWWANAHVERVGGVETAATAWVPGSKPIWLTEIGVPAVDKGANGPNVFPDPKSSESAVPPFSTGARDDLIQARAMRAILSRFDPALPGFQEGMNPAASVAGGRMVDPARLFAWCWDARPFPAFPDFDTVWADSANWQAGHWLTGRVEGAPLDELVRAVLGDHGLDPGDVAALDGFVDGYVVDRPMSARAALEPVATLFGFDAIVSGAGLAWRGRGGAVAASLAPGDLVLADGQAATALVRAQETDLPASVELGFVDAEGTYAKAAVGSRRLAGSSRREAAIDSALVLNRPAAQQLVETRLQDLWAGRETAEFALSPRALALEPGDVVALGLPDGSARTLRVTRITDAAERRVEARAVEPAVFGPAPPASPATRRSTAPSVVGPPVAVPLDLPATGRQPEVLQHIAVAADPWPGGAAVFRQDAGGGSFALGSVVPAAALVGTTLTVFPPGPVWRWDGVARLELALSGDGLAAIEDAAALAGGNLLAVLGPDGQAEIVSAAAVELIGTRRVRLSRFLRGLGGTEAFAARTVPAGATAVLLDGAVQPLTTALGDLGRTLTYRVGPVTRDYADPSYVQLAATVTPTALLPLAPVHLAARRVAGDISLTWTRRTRVDGDGWELLDVPLGEDREAYEVDVLAAAGGVVRTLAASMPGILYAAADEFADFGAPQSALSVRVAQLSGLVGRGRLAAATLPIL